MTASFLIRRCRRRIPLKCLLYFVCMLSLLTFAMYIISSMINVAIITSNHSTKHRSNNNITRKLPNLLIIGSKKCGTKALITFLALHPDIVTANREVHFFDNEFNFKKGFDWYRQQMPKSDISQYVVEKSPAYFVTNETPAKVHLMDPNIKLLLIVRNPVTRLISDYSQLSEKRILKRAGNNLNESNVEFLWENESVRFTKSLLIMMQNLDQMKSRSNDHIDGNSSSMVISKASILQNGIYEQHLKKWLEYFSSSQIHIVDGEQLIKQPHIELNLVEKFLQLNSKLNKDDFVFVKEKGFFCARNTGLNRSIANCLGRHKGRRHIKVPIWLLAKLEHFYKPHNQRFYQLTNRYFDW